MGRHSVAAAAAGVLAKRYWREADGRVVVAALAASGLSAPEFAARHGVDERRVSRWQRRLVSAVETGAVPGEMTFLPVHVRGELPAAESLKLGGDGAGGLPPTVAVAAVIEVVVGRYTVRLPSGFDVVGLHRVLGALEGRAC